MNEKELLKELKRIEEAEKLQERIIEKKKAHVEKLSLKGNSETIEEAKAQEERAITVLERIREDKRRIGAEFNKKPNSLEMQAKKVITIKDILKTWAEMEIIKNFMSFFIDTPKKNEEKRRLEKIEIEKLKVDIINRWIEIVKNNPGLTQSEIKKVYDKSYPNNSELEQKALDTYLIEREKEMSGGDKIAKDTETIKIILIIFLIFFIIVFLATCLL